MVELLPLKVFLLTLIFIRLRLLSGYELMRDFTFVSEFVVVDLLFYVHGKHLRSCRDGQLT